MIIDDFLNGFELFLGRFPRNWFMQSTMQAYRAASSRGERIFFTPGTMKMLRDKLENYDAFVEDILKTHGYNIFNILSDDLFNGIWIVFPEPIEDLSFTPVSALFCIMPSVYMETGKDRFILHLVAPDGSIAYLMQAEPGGAWEFEPAMHKCPFGKCDRSLGVLLPCEGCRAVLVLWAHVLTVSTLIASQYLAERKYEEKTYSSMVRKPRKGNAKKQHKQHIQRVVKVIDASEIIIPVHKEEEAVPVTSRGSWTEEAKAEGDLDYKTVHTRPFTRTYRHSRYSQELREATAREPQKFPKGITREQPVRKSRQQGRTTKVKASKYGD